MFPCVTSKQIKPAPPSRPDGLTYSRTASAVSLRNQAHGHGRSFHGKRKEKGIPRLRVLACQVHEAHDDFSLRICSARTAGALSSFPAKLLDLFVENGRFLRRGELSLQPMSHQRTRSMMPSCDTRAPPAFHFLPFPPADAPANKPLCTAEECHKRL